MSHFPNGGSRSGRWNYPEFSPASEGESEKKRMKVETSGLKGLSAGVRPMHQAQFDG
jgi:hypothetical protein